MDRSLAWGLRAGAGALLAGLALGSAWRFVGDFSEAAFAALLFADIVAASFLGVQAHRLGLRGTLPTAAGAGALGVAGFFAVPVLLAWGEMGTGAAVVFLVVSPLVAGLCSAGGAFFLARGVDRHRAEHGMVHAPR